MSVLHRTRSWIPALVVSVVPLAVLPGAASPFHGGKWFLVLTLVPSGLCFAALTGRLRFPHARWFVGWLGVSSLAAVLGVAPWMSIAGSPNRNAGLLAMSIATGAFVLGSSTGGDPRVQRSVLRAAIVGGGVVGILGIVEWAGVDVFGIGDLESTTRARSTWGSATFAAGHIVLVGPIAVANLRSMDRLWRRVAIISAGTMGVTLILTGTRGAWIGAMVAAVVMTPAWLASTRRVQRGRTNAAVTEANHDGRHGEQNGGARWSRFRTVGTVAGLVVFTSVVVVVAIPSLTRASGAGRIDLWRTTSSVIADRPVLGSGPDTQRIVLPSGITPEFEAAHGSSELHDRAHNIVLDTLITTGAIGLVVLGGLLGVVALDIRRRLRTPPRTQSDRPAQLIPTAVAAGLVAYLVSLLFAFGESTLDPIAWLLAGLLVGALVATDPLTPRAGDNDELTADDTAGVPTTFGGRGGHRIAVFGFGMCTVLGAMWAGGEVLAEYGLTAGLDAQASSDTAEALAVLRDGSRTAPARFDLHQIATRVITQSMEGGVSVPVPGSETRTTGDTDAMAEEMISYGLEQLEVATRVAGDDTDVMMDRAELLTAAGRPDEALEVYQRVLTLYPNSFRAHLGRGLAAIGTGDDELAERSWERATLLGPRDPRALVNLGILHGQRGEDARAIVFLERALEVSPGDPAATAVLDRLNAEAGG